MKTIAMIAAAAAVITFGVARAAPLPETNPDDAGFSKQGLERLDKRYVMAVQWHPEDQTRQHPEQLVLFESFAAAL